MRRSVILSLLLLSACGTASQPEADGRAIACGSGARTDLSCRLQVSEDGRHGLHLTLRQPEGGFHRLIWPKGGQLAAADGAEPLVASPLKGGGVEARIGGWTYRIEAKGGGLP